MALADHQLDIQVEDIPVELQVVYNQADRQVADIQVDQVVDIQADQLPDIQDEHQVVDIPVDHRVADIQVDQVVDIQADQLPDIQVEHQVVDIPVDHRVADILAEHQEPDIQAEAALKAAILAQLAALSDLPTTTTNSTLTSNLSYALT